MSEDPQVSPHPSIPTPSPGQRLKAERERLGLHIVALAAALKVPVRKLEALESDRWTELTDATFARALASSVARHLKMDAGPVLQGLPQAAPAAIGIPDGLGRATLTGQPAVRLIDRIPAAAWLVFALLLAAAVLYFVPGRLQLPWSPNAQTDAPKFASNQAGNAAIEPLPDAPQTQDGVATGVSAETGGAPRATPADTVSVVQPVPSGTSTAAVPVLALRAVADTWVEVVDSRGVLRVQRVLKAGEWIQFSDAPKYQVVLGNAAGAEVAVNGRALELAPYTRNNVARFDAQ